MVLDAAGLGLRVAQARQRAGLKQDDLARSSGIGRTAIAKIEIGARRVTALELARIAESVDERIEWFVDDARPGGAQRALQCRVGGELDRVAQAVRFVAAQDAGLRQGLRSLPRFGAPESPREAENLAGQVRRLLGVRGGQPVLELGATLADAGLISVVIDLGADAADAAGRVLPDGAVVVVNAAVPVVRRRIALARALGQLLVGEGCGPHPGSAEDRHLHRFARAVLLPATAVTAFWRERVGGGGLGSEAVAMQLAGQFRVDLPTLARRLLDLGLVEPRQAACLRATRITRADIVENDLPTDSELADGELPRAYEAAVLRLFRAASIDAERALELLFGGWDPGDLPLKRTDPVLLADTEDALATDAGWLLR